MDERKRKVLEQIRRELAKRGIVVTEKQLQDFALSGQSELNGGATPEVQQIKKDGT